MDKALIKKTGEISDVKSMWFKYEMELKIETDETPGELEGTQVVFGFSGPTEDTDVVHLANGDSYKKNQLVIGMDNIREYKIKKIEE